MHHCRIYKMERKELHRSCKNPLSCISNRAAKGIHPNPHKSDLVTLSTRGWAASYTFPGQDSRLAPWTKSQPFIYPLASVLCYKCGTKGKQQKQAVDCGIYFKPRLFI